MQFGRSDTVKLPKATSQKTDANLSRLKLAINLGGIVACFVTSLSYYSLIHKPLQEKAEADHQRVNQVRGLLGEAMKLRKQRAALSTEQRALEKLVAGVHERLPATAEDGEFLAVAAQVAEDEGLQIIDYQRGQATTKDGHSQIDLGLKCIGDYAGLCRFLTRLEEMPRVSNVTQLRLQTLPGKKLYPVEIRLVLYYGLETKLADTDLTARKAS